MESFGSTFGQLVRKKRGIEGYSQDDLVKSSGVAKSRISLLENGKIPNPQVRTIDALCVALNISKDEIEDLRHLTRVELSASLNDTSHTPTIPPPTIFFGRRKIVDKIMAGIKGENEIVIQSVGGMGGIGKTTIARQAAKLIDELELFPDGQIFVDFRGWALGSPMNELEALREICNQIEPKLDQRLSIEELTSFWRRSSKKNRYLIIFDNVRSREQIANIIPFGGFVIITTREFGIIPGATNIDVDIMGEFEAKDMAQYLCRRLSNKQAKILVDAVGYHPLAIELAAGRINDSVESIDSVIDELSNRTSKLDRMENLREVLRYSLDGLSEDILKGLTALSVLPGNFATWTVQALWGSDDVTDKLRILRRRFLVKPMGRARWQMHDLLRSLTYELLEEEREYRLLKVLAVASVEKMKETNEEFHRGGDEMMQSLRRIDRDMPVYRLCQKWASEHFKEDKKAAWVALSLPDHIITTLRLENEEVNWRRTALDAAEVRCNDAEIARAAGPLGLVYRHQRNYVEAEKFHRKSLRLAEKIGNKEEQAKQWGNLGLVFEETSEFTKAESAFEASISIFREIGDEEGVSRNTGNLGNVYQKLGRFLEAREMHEVSLEAAMQRGNIAEQAHDLGKLARIMHEVLVRVA